MSFEQNYTIKFANEDLKSNNLFLLRRGNRGPLKLSLKTSEDNYVTALKNIAKHAKPRNSEIQRTLIETAQQGRKSVIF